MTVEAALVLPLFFFACFILILPMKMLNTRREMQLVCESVCETAAQAAYLKTLYDGGGSGNAGSDTSAEDAEKLQTANEFKGLLAGSVLGVTASAIIREKVDDQFVDTILPLRSECMSDGETITVILDYKYRLPFPVLSLRGIPQCVAASRRAFIGGDPDDSSGGSKAGSASGTQVYVGASSTRYHKSASCHYLSNDLKQVSYTSLASLRNKSGSSYRPCSRCGSGEHSSVYIMPSGDVYHTDPGCTSIRSYAKTAELSEVEHLGPCSYCWH